MSSVIKVIVATVIGIIIGASAVTLFTTVSEPAIDNETKKPLYWVAPMDSNYRRDGPGKSPMGMDLVPVYEETALDQESGPGTVSINPQVVNNLGVRTALVERNDFISDISTVGYVRYDEDRLFHIHSRLDGWIEKLYVKAVGDPVAKDQPLYELYSPELVNVQEEYLLAVKSNNPALIRAATNKLKALKVSDRFIDTLNKTREVKQTVTFYSPGAGIVDHLSIREGFYVNPQNTMFSIAQLDQVWVEAEVFERDAALIKTGLPVTMSLDYLAGEQWTGQVDYVYPTLNSSTRTLAVRLIFDNPDLKLKPNMFAQVTIHTEGLNNALVVPAEAVIRTGKQDRVVLSLGDGQFKSVAVKLGHIGNRQIQVLDGLENNDVVVTSAQFLIDSESSKNSDFKRMSYATQPTAAWAEGTINDVMVDQRMLNISHGPIDALGMMGMTMNFEVSDALDMQQFKAGQTLHFNIIKADSGMYRIIEVHIQSDPDTSSANDAHHHQTMPETNKEGKELATIEGTINRIMPSERMIQVSHKPIEAWGMSAMTMFFTLEDHINMEQLKTGQDIQFEAYQTDTGYWVTSLMILSDKGKAASNAHQHHSI